jgi:tRNA A37 threonylcarbamoyladenosine dehydratase
MDRFSRIEKLLGSESFQRLQSRYVVVVGLGAVGGYVIEGLARSGIGRLRLVDFDVITRSNINRQILALESTLDRPKCEVAVERMRLINPACRVEGLQIFSDERTINAVLDPRPDMVIDAIDSLGPKVQLLRASHQLGISTLSSMGLPCAPIRARSPSRTLAKPGVPLARRVRQRLRKYGIEQGIGCVYSSERLISVMAGRKRMTALLCNGGDARATSWVVCPP